MQIIISLDFDNEPGGEGFLRLAQALDAGNHLLIAHYLKAQELWTIPEEI